MQGEFYFVYRKLIDLYKRSQLDFRYFRDPGLARNMRDLQVIEASITMTAHSLGLSDRLRPDARLFLLINIHQMVALPLVNAERLNLRADHLADFIGEDLRIILANASNEAGGNEISGHAVMTAISRLWKQLRSTGLDVWG